MDLVFGFYAEKLNILLFIPLSQASQHNAFFFLGRVLRLDNEERRNVY